MHRLLKVTEDNKPYLVRRYTDYIVSRMDNLQLLEEFKDYFYREKIGYPVETLETEMHRYCPEILEDHIVDNVVGRSPEYVKTSSSKENYHVTNI
jgi:hypothetical protein